MLVCRLQFACVSARILPATGAIILQGPTIPPNINPIQAIQDCRPAVSRLGHTSDVPFFALFYLVARKVLALYSQANSWKVKRFFLYQLKVMAQYLYGVPHRHGISSYCHSIAPAERPCAAGFEFCTTEYRLQSLLPTAGNHDVAGHGQTDG